MSARVGLLQTVQAIGLFRGGKMKEFKLMAITAAALFFVMSLGAHPGPERHPIEQELFDVESELSARISAVERRLNEKIESLGAPDDDAIADAVESAMNEALAEVSQSQDELQAQIEDVVTGNRQLMYIGIGVFALVFAGFIGLFGYVNSKTKAKT
ncbi:MAG: hypothetical protein F4219_00070 [Gammaproteobacteria bacterium]|nr:hypothetical protein [Gammaproteobacteria bacterium]